MRVKICGITQLEQGLAIANLGANALGFICVSQSPRYVNPEEIQRIVSHLPVDVAKIGVFVNLGVPEIVSVVNETGLTGIQLHGDEPPEFCHQLRSLLPQVELIKALRIKSIESLKEAQDYFNCVDTLLLDAYHPNLFGGTGKTIEWESLANFHPPIPWLLAGGLTPDNILAALSCLSPDGIDLSSGVENFPGDKDLNKVAQLFEILCECL